MKIHLITIFPTWFDGPFDDGMLSRGLQKGLVEFPIHDLREHATDKYQSVDDSPYGGGGGMLFKAEPLARCLDEVAGAPGSEGRLKVYYTSPKGITWDQQDAKDTAAAGEDIVILCGRYEGIDQRILDSRIDSEVSLGDFVMTGGEITALAIIDSVTRLVPGVLGNNASYENDSFYNGLLEGPHYTRPLEFEGHKVPDVLTGGNHAAIDKWRLQESLKVTKERRPELYKQWREKNPKA